MRSIWKYDLSAMKPGEIKDFEMPVNAMYLDAQMQNGVPMLWMHVETSAPKETARFVLYETGQEGPHCACGYVTTFQAGLRVLHLFYADPHNPDESGGVMINLFDIATGKPPAGDTH